MSEFSVWFCGVFKLRHNLKEGCADVTELKAASEKLFLQDILLICWREGLGLCIVGGKVTACIGEMSRMQMCT